MSIPHKDHRGAEPETQQLLFYRVKLISSSEINFFSHPSPPLTSGTQVIITGKYGRDMGRVLGRIYGLSSSKGETIPGIIRLATDDDLKKWEVNSAKEGEALRICREKAAARGLDMKLVAAHYLLDEPKILFFFTADERVDFRGLVKDLVVIFRLRIELRQVGVRDESRILGGMAVCGRTYCCHGLNDKLRSVSIKMVKEQNLSLNSMKISGPCGRLLCCLSYEYDFYHGLKQEVPPEGSRISHGSNDYKVLGINVFSRTVRLESSKGQELTVDFDSFKRQEGKGSRWMLTNLEILSE